MTRFDTTNFVTCHGKEPRGHGAWHFTSRQTFDSIRWIDHSMWFTGTYTDAKRRARAWAKRMNVSTIRVLG